MSASRTRPFLVRLISLAALIGLNAAQAQAAFPGENGRIAYLDTNNQKVFQLMTVRPDGSNKQKVLRGRIGRPSFSATGHRIMFQSASQKDSGAVFLVRPSGKHLVEVPHTAKKARSAALSPDGKTIAYAGPDDELHTIRVDGSHRRTLTTGAKGGLFGAAFAPNGKSILVSRNCGIARVSVANGSVHMLSHPLGDSCDINPDVSPDGKTVVFTRDNSTSEIWSARVSGAGHEQRLVRLPAKNVEKAVYSPNGKRILFTKGRIGKHSQLALADANGRHVRGLGTKVQGFSPSWGPQT